MFSISDTSSELVPVTPPTPLNKMNSEPAAYGEKRGSLRGSRDSRGSRGSRPSSRYVSGEILAHSLHLTHCLEQVPLILQDELLYHRL